MNGRRKGGREEKRRVELAGGGGSKSKVATRPRFPPPSRAQSRYDEKESCSPLVVSTFIVLASAHSASVTSSFPSR